MRVSPITLGLFCILVLCIASNNAQLSPFWNLLRNRAPQNNVLKKSFSLQDDDFDDLDGLNKRGVLPRTNSKLGSKKGLSAQTLKSLAGK